MDYVDTITEPGPNKILGRIHPLSKIESIRQRIEISLNKHNSKFIIISGHHDCAGNPTSIENQLAQIRTPISNLSQWYPGLKVIGLWIDQNWGAKEVNLFR